MFGITEIQQEMAAEKRRKDKDRQRDEALTEAHAAEEAGMEAMRGENGRSDRDAEAEAARKAIRDIGCTDPGTMYDQPGEMPQPQEFDRPYLDAGHSAASPQQGPPVQDPLAPWHPGILTPLPQSAEAVVAGPGLNGPIAATMKQHQARAAATMPRMPIPRGAA